MVHLHNASLHKCPDTTAPRCHSSMLLVIRVVTMSISTMALARRMMALLLGLLLRG